MLLISPIPRCYLPHKVRLIEKLSSDGWGGKGETLETDINFVYIEPCRSQRFSLGGDIPEVRAKMYFDAFSSVPNDVSFETGDEVIFGTETFTVSEVNTFFTPAGIFIIWRW